MLTIERIGLFYGETPADMHLSYGSVRQVPFAVVEIEANGVKGYGECLFPTPDTCSDMARGMLGRDGLELDQLVPSMPFRWQDSVHREMFSMALHDLVARHMGVPLNVLLGGRRSRRVRVMPCIFPKSAGHAARVACGLAEHGIRAVKVRIFGDLADDCRIIRSVRDALGDDAFLQADANTVYETFDTVADAMPRFVEAGLSAIEDPGALSLADYRWLKEVPVRPKIILDMPTRGEDALREVVHLQCCDAVNLHPNMQGTFSEVRDRAAATRLAGIGLQIGGTGYTGLGAFAWLHVAAAIDGDLPFGEVGGWRDHGMPHCTANGSLTLVDGYARVPDCIGHGGTPDFDVLSRCAKLEELVAHQSHP